MAKQGLLRFQVLVWATFSRPSMPGAQSGKGQKRAKQSSEDLLKIGLRWIDMDDMDDMAINQFIEDWID